LSPLLAETVPSTRAELTAAIERSRTVRRLSEDLTAIDNKIVEEGDGLALADLVTSCAADDAVKAASSAATLQAKLADLNNAVDEAATVHGEARKAFQSLDTHETVGDKRCRRSGAGASRAGRCCRSTTS
jgi:hypothetical protein